MSIDEKTRRRAARDMFRAIRGRVDKLADKDIIGPRLYRALLAEAILAELAGPHLQLASGETLVFMITESRTWLNEVAPL
jgi:hypothetical protein